MTSAVDPPAADPSAYAPAAHRRPAVAGLPRYVPGERPAGGRVVAKLSSNEMRYPPLPGVAEAVAAALADAGRYPDLAAVDLTAALAERHGLAAEQVAVGGGSVAVLETVLRSVAETGDEVVLAWRSFEAYPIAIQVTGATAVPVPVDDRGRHDLPAMAAAVTDRTRALLLCSPNNPTGPALTQSEVRELLAAVPRRVLVLLDEAYIDFVTAEDPTDGPALLAEHPNLVVLRTFSKAASLAALRIGYALGHPDVVAGIRSASSPFGASTPGQVAALAALDQADEIRRRVTEVGRLTGHSLGDDVVHHLFEVASGLDAMVVGEREIVGQVRRSLDDARAVGATTPVLEDVLQRASKASRRIAVSTDLAAAGRSVVAVALDLAAEVAHQGRAVPACPRDEVAPGEAAPVPMPRGSWAGARALVVGTGAYVGATMAALRRRECTNVAVWSASGRATQFAAAQDARAATDLTTELARADVVVTCRGTGTPVVDAEVLSAALEARRAAGRSLQLVIVDLALRRDVSAEAAVLPGVRVIDLDTVKAHAPAATDGQVHRAQQMLAEEVRAVLDRNAEREMDDVVLAVRDRVGAALEDELTRLPMGGDVPADQVAQALRRLAARLAHPPTVAARAAGRGGRGEEFVRALELVTGIAVDAVETEPSR
ncbi:MAG: aminotransferase class I/II-fold pyridoxal phosphate-dependent enzyme [Actinomycetaceae bacterium]